jgi:hypothetical protein
MNKKRHKQTFLVLVTFDLHGTRTKTAVYDRVKKRLAALDLKKYIRPKSTGQLKRLPHNTFAAKYAGRLPQSKSAPLRDFVRSEVKKALRAERVSASVFIAIGQRWAWGTARIQ